MSKHNCERVQRLLVDYTDNVLPTADAQLVETHLAACSECSDRVASLRASLDLAQEVWRDAARRAPRVRASGHQYRRETPIAGAIAAGVIAAGVLIALGLHLVGQHGGTSVPARDISSQQDISALIARRMRATRLATALEFLDQHPELEEYRFKAAKYVEEQFGEDALQARDASDAQEGSI